MATRRTRPGIPWLAMGLLAVEAQQVVALRLAKLAAGGQGARREARRMVTEKVAAALGETGRLIAGGSLEGAVQRTRRTVRANARRLAKEARPGG